MWLPKNIRGIPRSLFLATSSLILLPRTPHFNRDVFSGEIIHQKVFGQIAPAINSSELRHITVLGGGKSAADIVYTAVEAGKNVSWIIREHGRGPTGQGSAASAGPYANSVAAFSTRLIASLSPSIFRRKSIWDWLLHGTQSGRRLVGSIWRKVDKQNREIAGYQTREGRGEGFKKLESDTPYVLAAFGPLPSQPLWWCGQGEVREVGKDCPCKPIRLLTLTVASKDFSGKMTEVEFANIPTSGQSSPTPSTSTALIFYAFIPRPLSSVTPR